ncbi:MAG: hypothetical protein GY696_21270 [Gammaproteobacteria bacterium]|nr:hypothetical protein [Gammaproteobacteria bacterium]
MVNIAFGVHLAEEIMKIVNRLLGIGDQVGGFGPNSTRIMLSKAYFGCGPKTKLQ